MNLTLSVDEKTVARARAVARKRGTSLNALVRHYLEQIAAQPSADETLRDLFLLWDEHPPKKGAGSLRRADNPEAYHRGLR